MNSLEKKFKLIDASFKIIEIEGWNNFSLKKLAESQKISHKQIINILKSKNQILKEFSKMIDYKVENNFDIKDLENTSIKDNLFELIMLRLEYMQPYRETLRIIIEVFKTNPLIAKSVTTNILDSIDFYLELTNAYDDSFFDIFKKKSIFVIYGYVFTIWLNDDSAELSKTMSELDRLLTFSEKLALNFKSYTPF